jgi:two-component system chemotaxis response regulator CheY
MADAPRKSLQLKYDLAGTGPQQAADEPSRCILVVDDDAEITRFIGAVLGSRGIRTVSAYDAIQGFLVAQKQHPRLILVDWHMPAGGGAQLLRKLRDNQQTASIPVVVVTSDSAPNLREEAASLGAKFFLHKPLDPERLADLVAQFIA